MGRWLSPDLPFADQDPANPQSWNLYGYVRNNPLSSIDNDGLLTILVPGTWWKSSGGWAGNNPLFQYGDGELLGSCVADCTQELGWSGGNTDIARIAGAQMLRRMIARHNFAPGEKLTIITHSHGGNVALAASHLGLTHKIDTLITLNKPHMGDEIYQPGNNIGNFYNLSSANDETQLLGSDDEWNNYAWDPHAINKTFNTSSSSISPHAALIWDDKFRNMWWQWFLNQQSQQKPDNSDATNPNGRPIYTPMQ